MTVTELIQALHFACSEAKKKPHEVSVKISCNLGNEADDMIIYIDETYDSDENVIEWSIILEPTFEK
jgi:hypothetical protein